jgi:hypothetical protein
MILRHRAAARAAAAARLSQSRRARHRGARPRSIAPYKGPTSTSKGKRLLVIIWATSKSRALGRSDEPEARARQPARPARLSRRRRGPGRGPLGKCRSSCDALYTNLNDKGHLLLVEGWERDNHHDNDGPHWQAASGGPGRWAAACRGPGSRPSPRPSDHLDGSRCPSPRSGRGGEVLAVNRRASTVQRGLSGLPLRVTELLLLYCPTESEFCNDDSVTFPGSTRSG